jgi:hypothetical protein
MLRLMEVGGMPVVGCLVLTYLLHGAESLLRSKAVFAASQEIARNFM